MYSVPFQMERVSFRSIGQFLELIPFRSKKFEMELVPLPFRYKFWKSYFVPERSKVFSIITCRSSKCSYLVACVVKNNKVFKTFKCGEKKYGTDWSEKYFWCCEVPYKNQIDAPSWNYFKKFCFYNASFALKCLERFVIERNEIFAKISRYVPLRSSILSMERVPFRSLENWNEFRNGERGTRS